MSLISPSWCFAAAWIFCKSGTMDEAPISGAFFFNHFAVTNDRVQRRAQLVAHVREELRLGFVGVIGLAWAFLASVSARFRSAFSFFPTRLARGAPVSSICSRSCSVSRFRLVHERSRHKRHPIKPNIAAPDGNMIAVFAYHGREDS